MKTLKSMEIAGKKVTVIGGKRSGCALARLIVRLKGYAKVTEQDGDSSVPTEFKNWAAENNVTLEFGGHTKDLIKDSDMVVLSPGVPIGSQPVTWAKDANIPVLGEIEFAYQFCQKPVIAVTGSNGKTTVSTLISLMIDMAGHRARLCGNVGYPFSDYVLDLGEIDYVVLEVSSFQLESVLEPSLIPASLGSFRGFKPKVAVILNFSQNHLDRHKDLNEYFIAKKRIYLNQDKDDYLVLNAQDAESRSIAADILPRIVHFNELRNNGMDGNPNHSAVRAVGGILEIDQRICEKLFTEFKGVEHRLEKVRSLNGVEFINDSKATTALAALWALENIDGPVVMICGGRDKNIDFSILEDAVQRKVKHMFVIGEAKKKISQAFNDLIRLEECQDLKDAVIKARQKASSGDSVLLSPMCASFDMFTDFEERGRAFKQIVKELT